MKKFLFFALFLASAQMAQAEKVVLQTKNTTMVLNVEGDKQPQYVYYGAKLSDYDLQNLQRWLQAPSRKMARPLVSV